MRYHPFPHRQRSRLWKRNWAGHGRRCSASLVRSPSLQRRWPRYCIVLYVSNIGRKRKIRKLEGKKKRSECVVVGVVWYGGRYRTSYSRHRWVNRLSKKLCRHLLLFVHLSHKPFFFSFNVFVFLLAFAFSVPSVLPPDDVLSVMPLPLASDVE